MKSFPLVLLLLLTSLTLSHSDVTSAALELSPPTEQDFFHMLDRVEVLFARQVKIEKGLELVFKKNWKSDEINSQSGVQNLKFVVEIPGGLARMEGMTVDSIAYAACHELGHLLGGAPLTGQDPSALSVEGQADYFAASKCLKRLFSDRAENRAAYQRLGYYSKLEIRNHCKEYLCARILMAGLTVMRMAQKLEKRKGEIYLGVEAGPNVNSVLLGHPSPQCRLNTVVAGAYCPIDENEGFDEYDLTVGACMRDALDPEEVKGARPRCWFSL